MSMSQNIFQELSKYNSVSAKIFRFDVSFQDFLHLTILEVFIILQYFYQYCLKLTLFVRNCVDMIMFLPPLVSLISALRYLSYVATVLTTAE